MMDNVIGKKVLAISCTLTRNGCVAALYELTKLLVNRGFSVDIISYQDGSEKAEFEKLGCSVEIRFLDYKDNMMLQKKASDYDMVLANSLLCVVPVVALNGSDIPVIWWLHEGDFMIEYRASVLPDFSSFSDNIHMYGVSSRVTVPMKERYGVDIPVLPFSNQDFPRQAPRNSYFENEEERGGKVRFLTAGIFSYVKGIDVLLEALKLLDKSDMEKAEFYLCSGIDDADAAVLKELEDMCKIHTNVVKLPTQPRNELFTLMEKVDCVVVPSRADTVSNVAVEAMMKGTPVICTYECGVSDYLEHGKNALIVQAGNPQALAMLMTFVIRHKNGLDFIGEGGRAVYEKVFSTEAMEKRLDDVLADVCLQSPEN
jgi:glycosyltransferase involved in cell wall biosynthesis